ncbi:MAG: hypothetical protein ABIO55_05440, partial [Ginsengibacter sp.]
MNSKETPNENFEKFTGHMFLKKLKDNKKVPEEYSVEQKDRNYLFWQRDPLAILITIKKWLEKKMKFIYFFLFLSAVPHITPAQKPVFKDSTALIEKKKKQHQPFTATISFFNHSIAVPFHKIINSPFHPGFQAGLEGRYLETNKSKLFQTLNLGMFYNKYNGTGFYINTEFAYRYTSKCSVFLETLAGA